MNTPWLICAIIGILFGAMFVLRRHLPFRKLPWIALVWAVAASVAMVGWIAGLFWISVELLSRLLT